MRIRASCSGFAHPLASQWGPPTKGEIFKLVNAYRPKASLRGAVEWWVGGVLDSLEEWADFVGTFC